MTGTGIVIETMTAKGAVEEDTTVQLLRLDEHTLRIYRDFMRIPARG